MPLRQKHTRLIDLDAVPGRRQHGAMNLESMTAAGRSLDRINLRLAAEIFSAIDRAYIERPGVTPRNTWITEAGATGSNDHQGE